MSAKLPIDTAEYLLTNARWSEERCCVCGEDATHYELFSKGHPFQGRTVQQNLCVNHAGHNSTRAGWSVHRQALEQYIRDLSKEEAAK